MKVHRIHTFKGTDDDAGSYRRWWFFYLHDEDMSDVEVSLEATTNQHGFAHAYVALDDEDALKLAVAIPKVVSIWLGLSNRALRKVLHPNWLGWAPREFGLNARSGTIRLMLGVDPHGAASNRLSFRRRWPWEVVRDVRETGRIDRVDRHEYRRDVRPTGLHGRYLRWRGFLPEVGFEWSILRYDWRDQVLGRYERLEVKPVTDLPGIVLDPIDVRHRPGLGDPGYALEGEPRWHVRAVVAMPEGNYPCLVALERVTWGRRRWPWSRKTQTQSDVHMLVPIPSPGKGENSWDIDDDATYSSHGPHRSVAEATTSVASHVMERRERYGSGLAWVPDRGWPAGVGR